MLFTSSLRYPVAIFVALGLVSAASAAPITMSFQVADNPPTVWVPEPDTEEGGVSYYSGFNTGAVWECDWTVAAKGDPRVQLGAAITNTSASTQIFTLNVTMLASPVPAPSEMVGSVGGSLTDANGQSVGPGVWAQLTDAAPASVYTALIDGSAARTLHDTLNIIVGQQFDTVNIPAVNFGIPVRELGPAVLNTIGIELKFTLTPGDTASFTSVFDVIPEPASLSLAALGSLLILRRRRVV